MDIIDSIGGAFTGGISAIGNTTSDVFTSVFDGVSSGVTAVANAGDKYITATGNYISGITNKVVDTAGNVVEKGFDILDSPLFLIAVIVGGGVVLYLVMK